MSAATPPPGRRRAGATPPPPPSPAGGSSALVVPLALVVAAVLVLVLAGTAVVPRPDPATGRSVGGSTRLLVCPGGGDAPAGSVAFTSASDGDGQVLVDDREVTLPGGATRTRPATGDPVTLSAEGPLGAGLDAVLSGRGLATSCEAPRADWWFTGAGAAPGRESVLLLVNPRTGVATADVTVHGPRGLVEAPQLRGVSVTAGEAVAFPLAELAPSAGDLAVHVAAGRGLVTAAVLDRESARSRVAEWIPPQGEPATELEVPGVPRDLGTARLVLANPGDLAAVAQVRLSAGAGSFVPEGLEDTEVPPGGTVTVDLPRAAVREQTSVRVSADRPVVGGVVAASGPDVAHAAAATPWRGIAGLPLPGRSRTLVLAAVGDELTAEVRFYSRRGRAQRPRTIEVPAEGTVTVRVPRRAASLTVDSPGGLVGAVLLQDRGLAVVPLTPAPARTVAPPVRPAG